MSKKAKHIPNMQRRHKTETAKAQSTSGGENTVRYVHGPRGIHAQEQDGDWHWMMQDGLGSVRGVAGDDLAVQKARTYGPYGDPLSVVGTPQTMYGYTGEPTDDNGLVYLRERYYNPAMGTFLSQDPIEGSMNQPMSLNRYAYVQGNPVNSAVGELIFHNRYSYANGNPVNLTDPSGLCAQPTQWWNPVDANCYYSAVGLAQRLSQGNSQAYNAWFDVLIQRDWTELKAIEALGGFADVTGSLNQFMRNASILPSLLIRNPQLALQALQQWGCQNNVNLGFVLPFISGSGSIALPGGAAAGGSTISNPLGLAIAGGVGLGFLIALLFAGTLEETRREDENADCDPNCVVRGGVAAVGSFIQGYALRESSPLIYGFSVQYRPGVLLKELAQAGLRNNQLSYARDTEVIAVGAALGYVVSIPITSGFGAYHATVTVNDARGNNVPAPLPAELDAAFAAAFWRKMPNPSRPV